MATLKKGRGPIRVEYVATEAIRPSPRNSRAHPPKQIDEIARRALRNSTREAEGVLDMFNGSGSTLIAAEQTKRVAYAAELDPHYVDATVRRWQTLTGQKATHAEEKKTFDAIAKARGKG